MLNNSALVYTHPITASQHILVPLWIIRLDVVVINGPYMVTISLFGT